MELNVWHRLLEDETLCHLRKGLELGERSLRKALRSLLPFAEEQALSGQPVNEYILRRMLEDENVLTRALQRGAPSSGLLAIARADIEALWNTYCAVDWGKTLSSAGLPDIARYDVNPDTHESVHGFADSLRALLGAATPDDLFAGVVEHVRRFGMGRCAPYTAFTWRRESLEGMANPDQVHFDDLLQIDFQKEVLIANTADFLKGRPANNVLLCGSMGSGKTSCIKALLTHFAKERLRIVEVQKQDVVTLDLLLDALAMQAARFVVFIDDLTFDEGDLAYTHLKTALDGHLAQAPSNVLFYATSNRRNIVRDQWSDRSMDDDVHRNDTLSEKHSLSERIGIKLFFGLYGQKEYLSMVSHGLARLGVGFDDDVRAAAIEWERTYHTRSGRTAANFIKHHAAAQNVEDV